MQDWARPTLGVQARAAAFCMLVLATTRAQEAPNGPLPLVRPATVAVAILPSDAPATTFAAAQEAIQSLGGGEDGPFRISWIKDPNSWSSDALAGVNRADHDVLLLVAPGAPLPGVDVSARARRSVRDALARGMGLVLIHGAVEAFPEWPEFRAWTGVRVLGVPWVERETPFTLQLADRHHPAAEWLNEGWLVTTRLAEVGPLPAARLHTMLRLDPDATDWNHPALQGRTREFPIAWARWERDARVFCTLLGGSEELWKDEAFYAHLRGAIRWTLGQAQGEPAHPSVGGRDFHATESGVRYLELAAGSGAVPRIYERVRLNVRAWLSDGRIVQDTWRAGAPLEFQFGMRQADQGMEDGITTLRVGGRRRLLIPPELYSLRDMGQAADVPPNALLRVEVERLPNPTTTAPATTQPTPVAPPPP